jgi:hypothetical protein
VLLDNQPWLTQIADSAYRRIKGCVLTGAREPDYMFPGSHMSAFKRNYISVAREINSFCRLIESAISCASPGERNPLDYLRLIIAALSHSCR